VRFARPGSGVVFPAALNSGADPRWKRRSDDVVKVLEGNVMVRIAALIVCVLVCAQLLACDVQPSQGSSGTTAKQPGRGVPTGMPAGNRYEQAAALRKQAVGYQLKAELQMVRNACEMYLAENGEYPDFASRGWCDLLEDGYLHKKPANPHSPPSTASSILVTRKAGVTGTAVDPARAGWVFNASSGWGGAMYAAGLAD
jgi:hypothetical protein